MYVWVMCVYTCASPTWLYSRIQNLHTALSDDESQLIITRRSEQYENFKVLVFGC